MSAASFDEMRRILRELPGPDLTAQTEVVRRQAPAAVRRLSRRVLTDKVLRAQADRYVDEQAPWALKKTDLARMETVLYVLAETLRYLGVLLLPFMPDSANALLDQLAVPAAERNFAYLTEKYALKSGTPLSAPQGIFPRYVEPVA